MTSKYTLVLDSSQISNFLGCPQRWNYTNNMKLQPRALDEVEESKYMNAGTYGHKLLDIFYRAKMTPGTSLQRALEMLCAYNPDADICECGHSHELHVQSLILPEIQECSHCKTCARFRPHPLKLDYDMRQLVLGRVRDYIYKWKDNDLIPLSREHVEVGFSEPIYEDSENLFVLEGRIDLIGRLPGVDELIVDHKFQFKTHWLYLKSVQFKNYALVSKNGGSVMFMLNYIRLTKEFKIDSTCVRELVSFTKPELAAWKTRLVDIFHRVKMALQSGHFEQNWNSCGGHSETYDKNKSKYCWFNPLCEEVEDRMRIKKQEQLYSIKKEEFRPW